MSAFKMSDEMNAVLEREYALSNDRWHRENDLLAVAATGGPFWGVGKAPVQSGQIRGLTEFLPRSRSGR